MTAAEFFGPLHDTIEAELEELSVTEDEMIKLESRIIKTGYQETLGMQNLTLFSKTIFDFIHGCSVEMMPSSIGLYRACGEYIEHRLIPSMLYPTCMSGHFIQERLHEAYDNGLRPVGYQLIVYVGHINETLYHFWASGDDVRQLVTGIRFAVHEGDSRKTMKDKPLLAPGFMHQIDISTTIRKRIQRKKSDGSYTCATNDVTFYVYHGTSVAYEKVKK